MLIDKETYALRVNESAHDVNDLNKTHIPFSGSPHGHPNDPQKIILIVNPLSAFAYYFEFRIRDIAYVIKLPSLVGLEGETILMARIWVKQGSVGIRSSPFCVDQKDEALSLQQGLQKNEHFSEDVYSEKNAAWLPRFVLRC